VVTFSSTSHTYAYTEPLRKMKSRKFISSRRAVEPVIASLLLIAIAILAGIILYTWTIGIMTGLMQAGGASQTVEHLILVNFNGTNSVTFMNVGSTPINITVIYIDGDLTLSYPFNCTSEFHAINPGMMCVINNLSIRPDGFIHIIKVVSHDGTIFAFTVVGGQVSMLAPNIAAGKRALQTPQRHSLC
jgi:FlaG/FlaF family flagellin (archaellin)